MSIEVNGQVFDSIEDYENNYVVTDMNVEGMPWYHKDRTHKKSKNRKGEGSQFTKDETLGYLAGAMKSAMIVYAVFTVAILAFVAFCVFVWF